MKNYRDMNDTELQKELSDMKVRLDKIMPAVRDSAKNKDMKDYNEIVEFKTAVGTLTVAQEGRDKRIARDSLSKLLPKMEKIIEARTDQAEVKKILQDRSNRIDADKKGVNVGKVDKKESTPDVKNVTTPEQEIKAMRDQIKKLEGDKGSFGDTFEALLAKAKTPKEQRQCIEKFKTDFIDTGHVQATGSKVPFAKKPPSPMKLMKEPVPIGKPKAPGADK